MKAELSRWVSAAVVSFGAVVLSAGLAAASPTPPPNPRPSPSPSPVPPSPTAGNSSTSDELTDMVMDAIDSQGNN